MSYPFVNEENPFGSAEMASAQDAARAGMLRKSNTAIYCGELEGRSLFFYGEGGILLVAGARSGKLRDILAYTLCKGICDGRTIIVLDPKGELAAISRDQILGDGKAKKVITFNPRSLHGLPQHRINPVGYLKWSSPTLIPDLKLLLENWIPKSGSANGEYFELNARRWAEAICLTLIKMHGVLELPHLYRVVNLLSGGGKEWIDFAYEMHTSGLQLSSDVEEEIAAMREDRSGGFQGIIGELQKSVACLSDPLLSEAVSGPFDFELSELCDVGALTQLYLMVPMEMIPLWAPVLKSLFVGCLIEKSRKPDAPRQLWILDECGQLGSFPVVPQMFTYGAGIGIQPFAVFQSTRQMEGLAPHAGQLITSSASLQIYFATRDLGSAKTVSEVLGTQTLRTDDPLTQSRAKLKKEQLMAALLGGGDPFQLASQIAQLGHETRHTRKHARQLRTPDEVMRTAKDGMYLLCDDLPGPLYAQRKPYWTRRFMAGRYHPNPYHLPKDSVKIATFWGPRLRKIITEDVPDQYAHLPQYADGSWSYVEGFRP
ncbi:type IV secretory system conjugative DNA transfer family protein [Rhodophyticola porphyridii]|uniref:Type IV secretory system conjugative DNA transfer family protein n=1 Tax=Rhodophyticola porphyridii TaxID=1852017 RepID=A0A3L9Y2C1_9RHOB|nr:type IV secretory system conjugative DNA transfer family protein [Rhodophyticola porphyridii]RMA41585.1 hypothetical protein D9R08_14915 [Rhodophyticola porphyridii]